MADGSDGSEQPCCCDCSRPLTADEIEYYEVRCNDCEGKWLEIMREERDCPLCSPPPRTGAAHD